MYYDYFGFNQPPFRITPDTSNNGSALANCSAGGSTLLGRFPWKTVGTSEFRDHAGETLWYAVSDNFRTPVNGAINSETSGTLSVGAASDIVAVIFAPGAPVDSQDRTAGPLLAANYLEGGNELQDNNFYTRSTSEFNDQVVYVTRGQLMGIVEKRVLGDVARAIDDYQGAAWNISTVYPWLSNFTDPVTSHFGGRPVRFVDSCRFTGARTQMLSLTAGPSPDAIPIQLITVFPGTPCPGQISHRIPRRRAG